MEKQYVYVVSDPRTIYGVFTSYSKATEVISFLKRDNRKKNCCSSDNDLIENLYTHGFGLKVPLTKEIEKYGFRVNVEIMFSLLGEGEGFIQFSREGLNRKGSVFYSCRDRYDLEVSDYNTSLHCFFPYRMKLDRLYLRKRIELNIYKFMGSRYGAYRVRNISSVVEDLPSYMEVSTLALVDPNLLGNPRIDTYLLSRTGHNTLQDIIVKRLRGCVVDYRDVMVKAMC